MAKELRLNATIELPDDIWERADIMAAAKPVVQAFTEAVEKLGGKVEVDEVTPKPRADKGDAAEQYRGLGGVLGRGGAAA